jgi:hypothetical protein
MAAKQALNKDFRGFHHLPIISTSNTSNMTTFHVMIIALVVMATPAAAFTPRVFQTQTVSRTLGLGAFKDSWTGGFAESQEAFAYPKVEPDLSSLDILKNMDNIHKLERQQKVLWPQFSWLSVPGDEHSRIYQMFAPDISRIGYTDEGRVYSIICPQQGFGTALLGTLNVEVTVDGQRGWVDEPGCTMAGDLGVTGKVWITKGTKTNFFVRLLEDWFEFKKFPFSKENAIEIKTHTPGQPWNPWFPLLNGTDMSFRRPEYAQHWDEAYGVSHLNVEIGDIVQTEDEHVNEFNRKIIDIFNLGSGNIFAKGGTLSWNVWFDKPEKVDPDEWASHAERWRKSIDEHHPPPGGLLGSGQTYFDGSPYLPLKEAFMEEYKILSNLKVLAAKKKAKEGKKVKSITGKWEAWKDNVEDKVGDFFHDDIESIFEVDFERFKK